MARDAAATRARILAAATTEFAAHGLAGGRVDRIAAAAEANVRSIYVYFGSKEALFESVVTDVLQGIGAAAPLTEDDLPGWAGRMFDAIVARPEATRLNLWRVLEAPHAGPDDTAVYAAAIDRMLQQDRPWPVPPADLLILVANLAAAWVSTSQDLQAAGGTAADPADRLERHRAAVVEAVRLITAGTD